MKKTIALFSAAAALLSAGCAKSEIQAPDESRYIYIDYTEVTAEAQVINFSFVSTPDPSARIAIPLRFAGHSLTKDLPFAIRVVTGDDQTSLLAQSEYEFDNTLFRSGSFEQTFYVTLHRTPRMEEKTLSLEFDLVTNEHFQATRTGYTHVKMLVTAKISKPLWWTQEVTDFYLGEYNDDKFTLFSQHGYVGDFGDLDDSKKRYYALIFKYWLQENPQYNSITGELIKVTIQG